MRPFTLRRTTAAIATALLAIATLAPAAPAAALPSPPWVIVWGHMDTCYVDGRANLDSDAPLKIKHRRADGSLIRTTTIDPESGSWRLPCPGPAIKSGHRLEFYRGTETTPFRVFRVPRMELRPDRVNEIVRGVATGNPKTVEVGVSACDPASIDCEPIIDTTVDPAPTTGAWSVPIGDLRGGDAITAVWRKGTDELRAGGYVGQLEVTPGVRAIRGRAPTPGQAVTVTLRRGTWKATGRATVTWRAEFSVVLRRNGTRITPRLGDVITADVAPNAKITVPPWFLTSGKSGILGRCFSGGLVTLVVRDANGAHTHTATDTAFEDGSFGDPYVVGTDEQFDAYCANQRGDVLHLVGIPG